MIRIGTVLYALIISTLIFGSCDSDESVPTCIQEKIQKIKSEPVRNPPAMVMRYSYRNQEVFYFTAYCCDFPSELFDLNCNLLCSPDGGISGSGDNKCPDFFTKRIDEQIIWQDDR